MKTALLEIPSRRQSIMPELVRFFRACGGPGWESQLESFLKSFAGTEFKVPPPRMLAEVRRDEKILRRFRPEVSADERLAMLKLNEISHAHLREIYRADTGVELEPPDHDDPVEAATEMIRLNPSMGEDICDMFGVVGSKRDILLNPKDTKSKRKTPGRKAAR